MKNVLRVLIGWIVGEWSFSFTVNTVRFPFHAFWDGHKGAVTLQLHRGRKGRQRWFLNTDVGIIPYSFSRSGLVRFFLKLGLKGSVHNLYGGVSLKLLSGRYDKITVLNAILARHGYVMLESDENKSLRSVMDMLKDMNAKLKADVNKLQDKVQSQEELLTQQVRYTQDLSSDLTDTKTELASTTSQLAQVEGRLTETEQQMQQMQEQTDAICSFLGIQSVDQFLETVMRTADRKCQSTNI